VRLLGFHFYSKWFIIVKKS